MTGKLLPVKLRIGRLPPPPTNPPWIWAKVWARVRVGGNLIGGNFPCTVLNARKHLQSSHSFMVNVLIWQFCNSNYSYSLITVIFLEENICKHLHLQGRLSKKLLSPNSWNSCSFFLYIDEYKFTIENKKKQEKDILQTSKHLRMPGTNLKTIKFNNI